MRLTRVQIKKAVKEPRWQKFRVSLKGKPTKTKIQQLKAYLTVRYGSKKAEVQVQNYINALKRGGQLK